MNILIFTLIC